jgi:hypothetical protein
VSESRVLSTISGLTRDEVTGVCRRLHNEVLHNFYSLSSINGMVKSGRLIWAGHVTRME